MLLREGGCGGIRGYGIRELGGTELGGGVNIRPCRRGPSLELGCFGLHLRYPARVRGRGRVRVRGRGRGRVRVRVRDGRI